VNITVVCAPVSEERPSPAHVEREADCHHSVWYDPNHEYELTPEQEAAINAADEVEFSPVLCSACWAWGESLRPLLAVNVTLN
jgi:hypothetical protein